MENCLVFNFNFFRFNDFNDFEYSDSLGSEEDIEYDPRNPYENPFLTDEELTDDEVEKEDDNEVKKEKKEKIHAKKGAELSNNIENSKTSSDNEKNAFSSLEYLESLANNSDKIKNKKNIDKTNNNTKNDKMPQESLNSSTKKRTPKKAQSEPTDKMNQITESLNELSLSSQDEKKTTPKKKEPNLPYNVRSIDSFF